MTSGSLDLPTYAPAAPDPNPMFLEQRVYQGSSGRVYPLPVIDRIAEQSAPRRWKTVVLENQYLWVLILPELGGRVHALVDKTNGYDLIYRQEVIKPALVGLAGPWLSGGIEFNWPQHHRPATFMPTDVQLERGGDGSITVWCGDHDPLQRMKGMHGLCLRPGVARLELRVRVANRTPFTQTFLWWANVATRVHEGYQSFFPGDVTAVADHARRAMSAFPQCRGRYYGVDYAARGRHGIPSDEVPSRFVPSHARGGRLGPGEVAYSAADLGFYANIPVPTSYMALGSQGDFFGGYDHQAGAGLVHVANHHLSPGKKQWTWGNHEFGYAWDRNLTDPDGTGECAPYIELMAGVYTDNQPDFSFLMPGETRTWTQYWYPIQRLGPVQAANPRAAVHLGLERDGVDLGVVVTAQLPRARIELERAGGAGRRTWRQTLQPGRPFLRRLSKVQDARDAGGWVVRVRDENAQLVLEYRHEPVPRTPMPAAAREPETPRAMASVDELFLTGVHLEQYRHATRCPTAYWREALRRDPGEARCHTALGRWHLRRGEWDLAEAHLRRALSRLTRWNANPSEGEALYLLGWCRRSQDHDDEAYDLFYKATWNQAWQGAAFQALAEIDAGRGDWEQAEAHLQHVLRVNRDHPGARGLLAVTLQKQGRKAEARALLDDTLKRDPLDAWARWMRGRPEEGCDGQTRLDLAHDLARAGLFREALDCLKGGGGEVAPTRSGPERRAFPSDPRNLGTRPLVRYTRAWLLLKLGQTPGAMAELVRAAKEPAAYCFPARLEEIQVLEWAMRLNPEDARAPYYLGNLLYDRRRHPEAIRLWELSARLDPSFPTVWRNLGIACYNILGRPARARTCYERAVRADPRDARLVYERDQLWKRLGVAPARRRRELAQHQAAVRQRDDLSLEWCALHNQLGDAAVAQAVLSERRFQPWEGGEGQVLAQHVRTQLSLGYAALEAGDAASAQAHFALALEAPDNLGEARHFHASTAEIEYALGLACDARDDTAGARTHWRRATREVGDFQEMGLRDLGPATFFAALAHGRLREVRRSRDGFESLVRGARAMRRTKASIDYFATSLPTLLLFQDDLNARLRTQADVLEAMGCLGLGRRARGRALLRRVLQHSPDHAAAMDLLRRLELLL